MKVKLTEHNIEFYGTLLAWKVLNSAITYDYKGSLSDALIGLFHRHKHEFPSVERSDIK